MLIDAQAGCKRDTEWFAAREAESRWRFAHPDNAERRKTEYERMARIVGESCGE